MEKISQSLSKEYLPLVIYKDDLETLIDILATNGNEVEIRVDNYSYESISELISHKGLQPLNSIEISSNNPYCHIKLNTLSADLYVGDDSYKASGTFHHLDKVLISCLRKPSFLYSYYTMWIINLSCSALSALDNAKTNNDLIHFLAYYTFLPLIWTAYVLFIRMKKHSTIRLGKRSEATNFFRRNSDQILLMIVSAVIGAAVVTFWNKMPFIQELEKVYSQEAVKK